MTEHMLPASRKILIVPAVLLACICGQRATNAADPAIVSLSPAMTEIIFALSAQDHLVGVTTYCDYPEAASRINKVGDFSNPSLERIVGLHPDIIIINLPEHARIKDQLERLGKKVFVSSAGSLADIYREITAISALIHRTPEADSLIDAMRSVIKSGNYQSEPRVYIELSPRPLITIGSKSFLNELLAMAGGKNIFDDLPRDYPVVQQEEVIRRDPEIILVLHPEDITNRVGWEHITAVTENAVWNEVNPDILLRPAPRLTLGFQMLQRILHE